MGGGSPGSCKTLVGALAVVGLICFLVLGIVEVGGTEMSTKQSMGNLNFKRTKVMDDEKIVANHAGLDLNYMSNRRVPNGPDPIHNRRTGNSRRSPGKA